jgi:hypothetical protein
MHVKNIIEANKILLDSARELVDSSWEIQQEQPGEWIPRLEAEGRPFYQARWQWLSVVAIAQSERRLCEAALGSSTTPSGIMVGAALASTYLAGIAASTRQLLLRSELVDIAVSSMGVSATTADVSLARQIARKRLLTTAPDKDTGRVKSAKLVFAGPELRRDFIALTIASESARIAAQMVIGSRDIQGEGSRRRERWQSKFGMCPSIIDARVARLRESDRYPPISTP